MKLCLKIEEEMTENDKEFFEWRKANFGDAELPDDWKNKYADHLLKAKTKSQIWRMLCGPAKGSCLCKCPCPQGIAWDRLVRCVDGRKEIV